MWEILHAISDGLPGGPDWWLMPNGFPPWGTVYRSFVLLRDDGAGESINYTSGRARSRRS